MYRLLEEDVANKLFGAVVAPFSSSSAPLQQQPTQSSDLLHHPWPNQRTPRLIDNLLYTFLEECCLQVAVLEI
jgi:hypothetical protein